VSRKRSLTTRRVLVILWRALWLIPLAASLFLFAFFVCVTFGPTASREVIEDHL
jgi:hypothetical protein